MMSTCIEEYGIGWNGYTGGRSRSRCRRMRKRAKVDCIACEMSQSCGIVDRRRDVRCGFSRWDILGSLRTGKCDWVGVGRFEWVKGKKFEVWWDRDLNFRGRCVREIHYDNMII